jgi:hypothetical protein
MGEKHGIWEQHHATPATFITDSSPKQAVEKQKALLGG